MKSAFLNMLENLEKWMERALAEARAAWRKQEVPVGAVLIDANDNLLAAACNCTVSLSDPTAHAEILALRRAGRKAGNYRLLNTTLYATVEPCLMCMGAIIHARVGRVVFGAPDVKWGAAGSLYHFGRDERLNHRPEVVGGILQKECGDLMLDFFRSKR